MGLNYVIQLEDERYEDDKNERLKAALIAAFPSQDNYRILYQNQKTEDDGFDIFPCPQCGNIADEWENVCSRCEYEYPLQREADASIVNVAPTADDFHDIMDILGGIQTGNSMEVIDEF